MGRFLVRTANADRLELSRSSSEFMVFDPVSIDEGLKYFLESFSKKTKLVYNYSVEEFVVELLKRWQAFSSKFGVAATNELKATKPASAIENITGQIFISYAHEDFDAAYTLSQQLQALAGNRQIVWLDKRGGLQCGDDWKKEIRTAISHSCKMFIPLISKATQKRAEGFFRKEWGWAVERSEGIYGESFIIPFFIDEEVANTPTQLLKINREFTSHHIEKAINGQLPDAIAQQLERKIRKFRKPTKLIEDVTE